MVSQRVQQVRGGVRDLVDRAVERLLVGLRRLREAADLADVLQRGGADLVLGRRRLEVVERADVAAHAIQRTLRAVIVDCAHYRDGRRQHEGPMEPRARRRAICTTRTRGFVWLGMVEPAPEELGDVQEQLRPARARRRGRAELPPAPEGRAVRRAAITFVVLRTARYVDEREEVEFGEVSIFIGRRLRDHRPPGRRERPARRAAAARAPPELLEEGPAAVLWAILDKVVDDYAPVVEGLERDIEEVEQTVFSGAARADRAHLPAAPRGDRLLPRRAPAARPARRRSSAARYARSARGLRQYFRDVNDHLKLVNEEVVAQRDLLATILQANMAVVSVAQNEISVRQNETTRQLTLIATIFLPLTFITGFFGQNFGWLVEHISSFWAFAVLGVGAMALASRRWSYFAITRYYGAPDEPLSGGRGRGG